MQAVYLASSSSLNLWLVSLSLVLVGLVLAGPVQVRRIVGALLVAVTLAGVAGCMSVGPWQPPCREWYCCLPLWC